MSINPTRAEMQLLGDLERDGSQQRPEVPALPLKTLDLAALSGVLASPKKFAIERIAPLAEVTLFTGAGSTGKSLLGQQLATAAAAGLPCLGLSVQPGPAIYLTCEDDADQLHWRQQHICEAMGANMAALAGRLHLVSLRGQLDNELGTFVSDGKMTPTAAYVRIREMIAATETKLLFLDNVAHLFVGNENDRGEVTRFVNLLNRLAGDTGAAILLLGHPNKKDDDYSGSTAWLNAVRSQITIARDDEGEDPDVRLLKVGKANYTMRGEALRFRWHNWAFIREDDLPSDYRKELSSTIRASNDNAIFLKCLEERNRQRRAVSEKTGANFAPAVFSKMPEAKGVTKERLGQAMDRLFRLGAIERGPLWRDTEKGRDVSGLKRCDIDPQTPPPSVPQTHFPSGPKRAEINPQTHTLLSKDNNGQAFGPPAHISKGENGEG